MPSVNAGPSNTQTQNVTAGLVGPSVAGNAAGGYIVAQGAMPLAIAPTGTMGANGAVTLGTALALTYPNIYLYFPAGAVASGSLAGFYFTKMGSTTAGVVYNNTYAPGSGFPTIPLLPTLVSDAGPGAYTGSTTAQTSLQITVPPGLLGPNGNLWLEGMYNYPNNANTKTSTMVWGGITVWTLSATTTTTAWAIRNIYNRGTTFNQVTQPAAAGTALGTSTNSIASFAIDTNQPSTLNYTIGLGTATDYIVQEYFRVIAYYNA